MEFPQNSKNSTFDPDLSLQGTFPGDLGQFSPTYIAHPFYCCIITKCHTMGPASVSVNK